MEGERELEGTGSSRSELAYSNVDPKHNPSALPRGDSIRKTIIRCSGLMAFGVGTEDAGSSQEKGQCTILSVWP